MIKIFFLLSLVITNSGYAAIKNFNSQEPIRATEINENFDHIKNLFVEKNTVVQFHNFQSGSLITKELFEGEFEKLRTLGIEIDELSSEKLIAEEINSAFSQMLSGTLVYDDIPTANNYTVTAIEDQTTNANFSFINNVGTSSAQIITQPQHGSVSASGTSFSYNPQTNYFGSDYFTYTIFDGVNTSSIATVTLNVTPVNDQPTSAPQSLNTNEDIPINMTLAGSDIEVGILIYEIVTSPVHGIVTGTGASKIYTPTLDYFGTDLFTYRVVDSEGLASAPSTINIIVAPLNDAPVAISQTIAVFEDTVKVLYLFRS